MSWLHAAAGVVALGCALACLVGLSARRGHREVRGTLPWAALGAAAWCANVTSYEVSGLDPWYQLLWLPSAGFTAGAVVLWCGRVSAYGWSPPRWLVAAWLTEPLLVIVIRVVVGADVLVRVDRPVVVFGPLFLAHTAYCFGLLVAAVMLLARRRRDPSPAVRSASMATIVGATAALVAEALRLQLTDVVVTATLLVLTVQLLRRPDDFAPRPDPEALLDDLGALVFVFDRHERLVDLNGPARLFYALRKQPVPAVGTPAATLFGATLDDSAARVVQLSAAGQGAGQGARMSGYSHRLPSHGSPSHGWVTLLRRSQPVAGRPDGSDRPERAERRTAMSRLPAYDPATGLVTARSLRTLLDAAARELEDDPVALVAVAADDPTAAELGQAWEQRPRCIAAARLDADHVVLVLRTDGEDRGDLARVLHDGGTGVDAQLEVVTGRLHAAATLLDELITRLGTASEPSQGEPAGRTGRRP